jgi:hypothetical protein
VHLFRFGWNSGQARRNDITAVYPHRIGGSLNPDLPIEFYRLAHHRSVDLDYWARLWVGVIRSTWRRRIVWPGYI